MKAPAELKVLGDPQDDTHQLPNLYSVFDVPIGNLYSL